MGQSKQILLSSQVLSYYKNQDCWSAESAQYLDLGGGYMLVCICKNSLNCTLKICLLYHKQVTLQ